LCLSLFNFKVTIHLKIHNINTYHNHQVILLQMMQPLSF